MQYRSHLLPLMAGALLASGSAFAQTAAPKPPNTTVPEKIAPGAEPTGPAKNLSDRLNNSNGVIKPKEVDPGIEKPAPQAEDPNVIPPPGTSRDPTAPQAK
jgi:hypothetical protein